MQFSQKYLHFCDMDFSDIGNLKRHISSKHDVDRKRSYKCHLCDSSFFDNSTLKEHVARIHKNDEGSNHTKKISCDICKRDFTTKQHRDIHVKKTHEATAVKQETL